MNKCLNCGKEISQTPKKRERRFCDSTCRSNYWQKQNRINNTTIESVKIEKKDNKTVTKVVLNVNDKPVRKTGENSVDYAFRINEWKKTLKQRR